MGRAISFLLVWVILGATVFAGDRESLSEVLLAPSVELKLPDRPPAHQFEEAERACCWRFTIYKWSLNEGFLTDLTLLHNILIELQTRYPHALRELFLKCYRKKFYEISSHARLVLTSHGLIHHDDRVKYLWDRLIDRFFISSSDQEVFHDLYSNVAIQDWAFNYPESVNLLENLPGCFNAPMCLILAQRYGLISSQKFITREERSLIIDVLKQQRENFPYRIEICSLEAVLASYGIKRRC